MSAKSSSYSGQVGTHWPNRIFSGGCCFCQFLPISKFTIAVGKIIFPVIYSGVVLANFSFCMGLGSRIFHSPLAGRIANFLFYIFWTKIVFRAICSRLSLANFSFCIGLASRIFHFTFSGRVTNFSFCICGQSLARTENVSNVRPC